MTNVSEPADLWRVDRLDLDGYLDRVGRPAEPPSRAALDALHEAHVRTFTFDNIDVLLDQHPGVGLEQVTAKYVGRGRGGYCFEHGTVFAAALERLGYAATRRLGRVGPPETTARTHCVVVVDLDGERLLADPGFGMSLLRPMRAGRRLHRRVRRLVLPAGRGAGRRRARVGAEPVARGTVGAHAHP